MTKNNISRGLLQGEYKEYSPEQFGLTQEFVCRYRQQLFANKSYLEKGLVKESDGLFLYAWSLLGDTSGKENGGYCFGEVAITPEYHAAVSVAEEYIFKHYPALAAHIKSRKNLIELGHGLGQANKVKHVIDPYCLDPNKMYTHYGFDVAGSVAEKLPYEYGTQFHIRGEGITSNRFDTNLFDKIDDKCYLILGGSIGNYEDADVVKLLSRLTSDSLYAGRPIIVSHFLAPQEPHKKEKINNICASYKTPQVEKFIMKGFAALGLDTTAMQLAVTYEESKNNQPARIKVGAKLLKSMKVDIGDGKTMSKRAGEYIWAISSRRYTVEQFDDIAKQAGCTIKHTASYGHMGVSVLMSKRKPLPTNLKYAAIGLASLFTAFQGGIYFNQWLQSQEKKKQMHEFTVTSLANNLRSDYYNTSLEQAMSYHEHDMQEFVVLLQERYGVALTEEQKLRIQALFIDWVRKDGFNVSAHMSGGHNMMYDHHLLYSDDLDRFVWECGTSLANEGIPICPNSRLASYTEALRNTYFYQGPRLEFRDVKQLGDYKGYIAGVYQDGSFDIQRFPAGMVIHNGKPYLVFQVMYDGYYILEQRPGSLYGYDLSPQKYVADIVGKGQAKILAEQIRDFLNEKYGAGPTAAANGQEQIVRYIMDMYAEGYDLSYLLNASPYDPYRNTKELLDVFVMGYVLPDIGHTLRNGEPSDKMYELDRTRIDSAQVPAIRPIVQMTETYMQQYLALYTPDYNPAKYRPLLLKHLMLDRAWRFLKNDEDVRCWLREHHTDFAEHGLDLPWFPDWIEHLISIMEKDANNHIVVASDAYGIEQTYSSVVRNRGYVFANGDIATLVDYYEQNWKLWKSSTVVARVVSPELKQKLWQDYKQGLYGKLFTQAGGRGGSFEVTDKSQVLTMLISKLPYSRDPLARIVQDYTAFKAAWKTYQDKKK